MDRYDEQARKIWDVVNGRGGGTKEAIAAYASALRAAATVQEGCVMLPGGKVVKVLGTLPMTADGCVVGDGASIWYPATENWHVSEPMRSPSHNESGWRSYYTSKSYGERPEAAAAARKEGV